MRDFDKYVMIQLDRYLPFGIILEPAYIIYNILTAIVRARSLVNPMVSPVKFARYLITAIWLDFFWEHFIPAYYIPKQCTLNVSFILNVFQY